MKWLKKALGGGGGPNRKVAEELVTRGYVHAREGRVPDALALYLEAQAADETLAVAHLNEGLARLDLLNTELARADQALDVDARAERLEQIAVALTRALKLEHESVVGWRALARLEQRRASFARAEDAWKNVHEQAKKDSPDRAEADKALAEIAEDARIDRARRRAIAGQALDVDDSERKAALDDLLLLLRPGATKKPVERGLALAGALARRAHDPRARELLGQAVAADPADHDALRDLAGVCLEQNDLSAALGWSMKAYVAQPTDAALVCNVGVCHLGLGDLDKAGEFIEIAERLEPKDPIVLRAAAALKAARASAAR